MFGRAFWGQAFYGGSYWGKGAAVAPGGGGPPPAAGDLFEALRTYLRGRPALASLTDVYLDAPGQQSATSWPYLVMSPVDSPAQTVLQGGTLLERYEVQFSTLAASDTQATDLGKAAHRALSPFSGTTLVWADGAEALRQPGFRGRLILQPGRTADNRAVWAYVFSYQLWITTRL